MGKHTIFVTLTLTFVWIILMEGFSWQNAAIGMFMSMLSMHFVGKFFNFDEIRNVSFFRLALYPFWLIARIYADALFLTKLILTDAKWGKTTTKLNLDNESLRIILAFSITLTPGSVYLELKDNDIVLLSIDGTDKLGYPASNNGLSNISAMLRKAQK
ncbi:MAG: Na+/H+ antiporter subunit E [Oscillospiraceae bacterium]|nr:Na+/H+ antiporter subunit E [Oscillospiraceae bacterium]